MLMPADVTVAILQHVPQPQRLNQCALVCRSWLAAAVAASIDVSAQSRRPAHTESLSRWLQHHGSGVSGLSVVDCQCQPKGDVNLDVPFSCLRQLQALHLSGLNIKAGIPPLDTSRSSSLHSGRWADLTALTSLHLERVTIYNVGDGSEFNSITSLRRLVLRSIHLSSKGLPSLAPLTGLICLVLEYIPPCVRGDIAGIGQLSHLKHLELELETNQYDIQVLSSLPVSLTHLDLGTEARGITAMTAPRLGELTALVHLEVRGDDDTCFDPQLLSNLVHLQHLRLCNCHLTHDADALQGVDWPLAVLPSVVSSPALTELDLRNCWWQENAVCYIFKGQQCPALQHLQLGAEDFYLRSVFGVDGVGYSATMNALNALVAACPALQELQLLDTIVDPDCYAQLSALEHLTGISKLALGGDVIHDDSIVLLTSLALPALRDLKVDSTGFYKYKITASWVLHLQEFTQLTRLEVQLGLCWANDPRRIRLLFFDQNGLTHLPELLDAAVTASEQVRRIEERD